MHFARTPAAKRLDVSPEAAFTSHGENRGSSPLGSASDFNMLASNGPTKLVLYGKYTARTSQKQSEQLRIVKVPCCYLPPQYGTTITRLTWSPRLQMGECPDPTPRRGDGHVI